MSKDTIDYTLPGITPGFSFTKILPDVNKLFIVISHSGGSNYAAANGGRSTESLALDNSLRNGTSWNIMITDSGEVKGQYPDLRLPGYMCGAGNWKGHGRNTDGVNLNNSSITVMLCGNGCLDEGYSDAQISSLINFIKLNQDKFEPLFGKLEVLALADVDSKHCAPGPNFPWEKLAEAGVVGDYPTFSETYNEIILKSGDHGVTNIQKALISLGYYLPEGVTGVIDKSTFAVLTSLDIHYNHGKCGHYNVADKTWTGHGCSENLLNALDVLTHHEFSPLYEPESLLAGEAPVLAEVA